MVAFSNLFKPVLNLDKGGERLKLLLLFALALLPMRLVADVLPGHLFLDCDPGVSDGTVVTVSGLNACSHGTTFLGWETLSDPPNQTQGAIPDVTFASAAAYPLYTPVNVGGTVWNGRGTKGIKFDGNPGNNEAISFEITSPGFQLSVGFYFQFNSPGQANQSPRDICGLRSDPSGNYQFLQMYDGTDSGVNQTHFHTHWAPGGTGVGNDINFVRNKWYWVTMVHVAGGGTFQISFYDPANSYALVGTSTASIAAGGVPQGVTTFQLGYVQYAWSAPGSGQSVYVDNVIINTNGVFPLGPGGGPLVPDANRTIWYGNVGVPGGIPNRTTIFTNMTGIDNTGVTDVHAALQSVLDNCPSNQVVFVTNGTYNLGSAGLTITTPYITLRGNGSNNTIFTFANSGGNNAGIAVTSGLLTGSDWTNNITSGATQGSSNIVVSGSFANIRVGYVALIDQTNDGVFVNNTGVGGTRTDISRENGTRCSSTAVLITATNSGGSVTFWPPLVWTYTNNPQLYIKRSSSTTANYVMLTGLENFGARNLNGVNGQHNLYFNRAAECWAKGVMSMDAAYSHINCFNSYRLEFRQNYLSNSVVTTASDGYALQLDYQSDWCLVEDNIFYKTRDWVQTDAGSCGNAILYNYHTNALANTDAPAFTVHTGGGHSTHHMMNLWEGNITYKPTFDYYWGSGGPETIFRNEFKGLMTNYSSQSGAALIVDTTNWSYSIVGNILGYPGITNNPNFTTYSRLKVSTSAYNYDNQFAALRIGYYSDSDDGSNGNNGTNFWTNFIAAANFDWVSVTTNWDKPTTVEPLVASYYYPQGTTPAYWGTLAYPPFDPTSVTAVRSETNTIPAAFRFAAGVDGGGGTVPATWSIGLGTLRIGSGTIRIGP